MMDGEILLNTKLGTWMMPKIAGPNDRVTVIDGVPWSQVLVEESGVRIPTFLRWSRVPDGLGKASGMRNSPMKAFSAKKSPFRDKKSSR